MNPESSISFAPESLDEALQLLERYSGDAKVIAGGHGLHLSMTTRLAPPKVIIDLTKIEGLKGISESDGTLVIGALTTHDEIAQSALIQTKVPIMVQTANAIGDASVRHSGTLGGNLAYADPASDWPATILALDAELKIASPAGERLIRGTDIFRGYYTTALEPDEILTEIHIPLPDADTKGAYLKQHQVRSGFALVGVAVVLTRSDDICRKIAVGITGISDTPYRAKRVEQTLTGKELNAINIIAAAEKATDDIYVLDDLFASRTDRKTLAKAYTRRAIESAAS
jgi:aerobic carbon-monoxide dehydrogenase medium subunit